MAKIGHKVQNFAFFMLKVHPIQKSTPPLVVALGTSMIYAFTGVDNISFFSILLINPSLYQVILSEALQPSSPKVAQNRQS